MKRFIFIPIVLVIFMGIGYGAELKVGYVDLQRALNESEGGKKAKGNLENIIKSKQVLIDERGKAIEAFKAEIEQQSALLSEEARKNKQDDYDKKVRDYKRFVQDSQEDVKKKEVEFTNEILGELKAIVEEIGFTEHFSLILEKVEGVVLYADSAIDITEKVIQKYDESIKAEK
jgi:outer membrane protein